MTYSREKSFREIVLSPPYVNENRAIFSWNSTEGFHGSSFWIEYPEMKAIEASPGKLAEAYFPVCLGFAALGRVRLKLPVRIDEQVLARWCEVIRLTGRQCFREAPSFQIINGEADAAYRPVRGGKTALLFGGGTESLLTLAYLREQGQSPVLVSLGGPRWSGSDPQDNPDKFLMDEKAARELGLDRLHIRSNFRELVRQERWEPYLKPGLKMINAVLALPWFISLLFPVAEQCGIVQCVNGNEKMNFPHEYFCFSPGMTDHLGRISRGFRYQSRLGGLLKEEVCRELYGHYAHYAKYQYSCWNNHGRRWCYDCESCIEYYMLLKANGLAVATVGMDEARILANVSKLVMAVARSGEGRPGEIWTRLCRYPELRREPELRRILNLILVACFLHRHYVRMPDWFQRSYRFLRSRIGRLLSYRVKTAPA